MRILLLNYEFPPLGAGGGKASQKIAESLVEMGHTVRVVTSRPTQPYRLTGNLMLLIGVGFWVYLAYAKITFNEDISDHGFTLLGTLLLLIGFILRNTALTWELTSPVRGLKRLEFINGVEVRRVPVFRRRPDYCSIPEMGSFVLSAAWYSLRNTHDFKPDIVHIFFAIPDGPLGWLLKRSHRLPYIVSLRGADVPSDEVQRFATAYKILRPIIVRLYQDADAMVAVSNGLRKQAHYTTPDLPIEVITNAIDLSYFTPPLQLRQHQCIRLIFVGRLTTAKNPIAIVKALNHLKTLDIGEFELELVGDGDQRADLEQYVIDQNLTKWVKFVGWVERDQLLKHYQQADIFVTATTWEGMPNTVLEAMATGLPVVGTQAPGLDQLVRDGRNGYIIGLNDIEALADRLARLISNSHERQRMGKESRKIAEREFSWEHISAQYVDVYNRILAEKKGA
ncbi:MAG: glycosyltransferase family 4 protein [Chloroflexota bacterium]